MNSISTLNDKHNSSLHDLLSTINNENVEQSKIETLSDLSFCPTHQTLDVGNHERVPLKHRIRKTFRSITPTRLSNRISLFNKVKSRTIGTNKNHQFSSKIRNETNKYSSSPSVISMSEVKSSSTNEGNQSSIEHGADLSSENYFVGNTNLQNVSRRTMASNDSLDAEINDTSSFNSKQKSGITGVLNSKSINLNKFKDQLTQRTRTVINRTPSFTSLLATGSTSTRANTDSTKEVVYWTEVFIEKGIDLSSKDINGTSDPYVKVLYGTEEKYTTSIIESDLNPVWNEKFTFFVHDLSIPLYFNIFDHDRIGRDETMGTKRLDLRKLPINKLYVATLELENEQRNDGKTGALIISLTLTSTTVEFRDEVLRTLAKHSSMRALINDRSTTNNGVILTRRTIDVFIIKGRNLLSYTGNKLCNPYIKLKFGNNKKYRTLTIKSTNNPKWHQSFMYDTTLTVIPPLEFTVVDDVSASGEFIGRGICNLSHLEEERTHKLSIELEDGAGIIDTFITITGTTPLQEATNDGESSANVVLDYIPSKLTDDDIQRYKFLSSLQSIVPIFDVGRVEIKIYQARDLSSKDINGKSDPFCIVELDSNRLRTHTIYKSLNPIWNKSFVMPVQDIHSVLDIKIYDEDANRSTEFIGRVAIPLLAIKNGQKKWMALKDQKCLLPVRGAIEIEATLIYTTLKAVIRTFNPRQESYYQVEEKFSVAAIKQHVARIQNIVGNVVKVIKFVDYCFHWENPWLSFIAFMASIVIVWCFELYMLPCTLLVLLARNCVAEYRRGRLGKAYASQGDETISVIVQPVTVEEEFVDGDANPKEQKKSFLGLIASIQGAVLEIQGYIDSVASTFERIKNVFNFTVPWLSILLIIILVLGALILYYIPLRYLILAFVINKFTKRFRKPKGYIDNNEAADFISRLPSDPELMQYREIKCITPISVQKKTK